MQARIPSQRRHDSLIRLSRRSESFLVVTIIELIAVGIVGALLLLPLMLFLSIRYLLPSWDRITALVQQNDYVIVGIYLLCLIVSVSLVLLIRFVLDWIYDHRLLRAHIELVLTELELEDQQRPPSPQA